MRVVGRSDNVTSQFDMTNDDPVKMMIIDWIDGMAKIKIVHKYDITEHAYKLFNKECKEAGYVRTSHTKGNFKAAIARIANASVESESVKNIEVAKQTKPKIDVKLDLKSVYKKYGCSSSPESSPVSSPVSSPRRIYGSPKRR